MVSNIVELKRMRCKPEMVMDMRVDPNSLIENIDGREYKPSNPATDFYVYITINCNPDSIRYGYKYVGVSTKAQSIGYSGSSNSTEFITDYAVGDFETIILEYFPDAATATVAETKIQSSLNAAKRKDFYNKSNSTPALQGLDMNLISEEEVRRLVHIADHITMPDKKPAEEIGQKIKNAQAYYDSQSSKHITKLSYIRQLIGKVNHEIQTRVTLLDQDHVKEIGGCIRRDMKLENVDAGYKCEKTKPALIFYDATNDDGSQSLEKASKLEGGVKLGNSHHTCAALEFIGEGYMSSVWIHTPSFFGGPLSDPEIIEDCRSLSSRINNSVPRNNPETKEDLLNSITNYHNFQVAKDLNHFENTMQYQIAASDDEKEKLKLERSLEILKERIKSYEEHFVDINLYLKKDFDSAVKTLEISLQKGLVRHGHNYYPVSEVKGIIGKTKEEFCVTLVEKDPSRFVNPTNADGSWSKNAVPTAALDFGQVHVAAASLNSVFVQQNASQKENFHTELKADIILYHSESDKKGIFLNDKNRELLNDFLKKLKASVTWNGAHPCPDVQVYVLPCYVGQFDDFEDKVYIKNLRDV